MPLVQRTNTRSAVEDRALELTKVYETRFREQSVYANYEYDPEAPVGWVLWNYKHTVLSRLLFNFGLWWCMFIYGLTTWIKLEKSDLVTLPKLNINSIGMPIGLISFLVAFHSQSSWTKYHNTYLQIVKIQQLKYDLTTEISSYLSTKDVAAWELTRMANLMHFAFYTFVADEDEEQTEFVLEDALELQLPFVPPKGGSPFLCTGEEFNKLSRLHVEMRISVMRKWTMNAAKAAFATLPEYKNQVLHLDNVETRLQIMRETMAAVIAECSRPVPMHYTHLVVFSVWICTTMYAYAAASTLDSRFSWIPLLVYTGGINGILEVCRCLSLPFGNDEGLDLPAAFYFQSSLKKSFEILMEESASDVDVRHAVHSNSLSSSTEDTPLLSDRNRDVEGGAQPGCFGRAC